MAAKAAMKLGLDLLNTEKPRSSVSSLLEILTSESYDEDDFAMIPELIESINVQSTGPAEASRAIRKKLKYSNVHGQLRALTILKALVENCGPKFQSTFANERLVDRIKLMAGDPHTDERVKKKIMSVLGSWYREFKDDPKMQLVAGLYASCGGGRKTVSRTAATEAYEKQQAKYEQESRERVERKAGERSRKEEEKARLAKEREQAKRKPGQQQKSKRPPFNFEQEKPKIMASVGAGTQSAQALINALQHVNREKESVLINERVQLCLTKAKADRKLVVRYIQLVDMDADGDFIGTLIATNEQVLNALALYDRMSKPIDLDSDDEHIEAMKQEATRSGLHVPGQGGDDDDDATSIRSRLSAFELQDREVDKLQERQRERVQKAFGAGKGVHPDLQDLAFGPTAGSSTLPPPLQPRTAGDEAYARGSLSDYSDYSSSSSDGEAVTGAPPTSASSSSASNAYPSSNARSYARFMRGDDEVEGKGKGLLEEDDDPFADPDDGASVSEVGTPGIVDRRMEWREV